MPVQTDKSPSLHRGLHPAGPDRLQAPWTNWGSGMLGSLPSLLPALCPQAQSSPGRALEALRVWCMVGGG